jgi:hypothetical protein
MKKHLRLRVQLALAVFPVMISALAFAQAAQTPAQPSVAFLFPTTLVPFTIIRRLTS